MKSESLELDSSDLDRLDLEVEEDELILSPAQRSVRCVMTLFCLFVLLVGALQFSSYLSEEEQEKPTVSTNIGPKATAQGNQDEKSPKLMVVLTPYSEVSAQ